MFTTLKQTPDPAALLDAIPEANRSDPSFDQLRTSIAKETIRNKGMFTAPLPEHFNLEDRLRRAIDEGGATVRYDGREPAAGFCYADSEDISLTIPRTGITDTHLRDFINRAATRITAAGVSIGVGHHPVEEGGDGIVYLDLAQVSSTAEHARAACRKHNQVRFYDLCRHERVIVNPH